MNSSITSSVSNGACKGAVGKFHYHHTGKMQYVVTYGMSGPVIGRKQNISEASQYAKWFYDLEKSGEYFAEILAERIEACN